MELKKAKLRYSQHKARAKHRGIGFELTFAQWLAEWGDKLDERGRRRENYCKCRVMDKGPYAVGNVFIGRPKRNGHTRKIVIATQRLAAIQADNKRYPEAPDPSWEEENPWLPSHLRDKGSSWRGPY